MADGNTPSKEEKQDGAKHGKEVSNGKKPTETTKPLDKLNEDGKQRSSGEKKGASNGSSGKASGQRSALRNGSNSRRVSFSSGTKKAPESYNRRIYLGNPNKKQNPKVVVAQMAGLFLGILGFMFFIAFQFNSVGADTGKKRTSIKDLQKMLVKIAIRDGRIPSNRKRSNDCGLFLHEESSIPQTGLALFSGKKYKPGDVVMEAGDLERIGESTYVSHAAMLLKHHPRLGNLKEGTTVSSSSGETTKAFVASRTIRMGDEFFLDYSDHPQAVLGEDSSLFYNIPTEEDYNKAHEIMEIEKELQLANSQQSAGFRRRNNRGGGSKSLMAIQEIVRTLEPRVASVLPGNKPELVTMVDDHEGHIMYATLRNRTVIWLELNARCMDNVEVRIEEDGSKGVYARVPIAAGKTITVAPIYARQLEPGCTADSSCSPSNCFGHFNSTIQLCPMLSAADIVRSSHNAASTNSKYEWSKWNNINTAAQLQSVDDAVRKHPVRMTFDILATSDIEIGEKIILDIGAVTEYGIAVNDDFLSRPWRGLEELSFTWDW